MLRYFPEGFLIDKKDNTEILSSSDNFMKAFHDNTIVEARAVYCDRDHNLHIDFGFIHGVIPREECAIGIKDGSVKDIAIIARVNKPIKFKIKNIIESNGRKTAVLSRLEVQKEFTEKVLKKLNTGDIINAKITHLESFGAFCDIGCGVNALLPIDNISVSRIPHPKARFNVGDDIKVIVKAFDNMGRITLSHKELLGTWEENASFFNVGETVSGIVRSVESYGIFIELAPNLAGLSEYVSGVYEGQQASVYIKSIIPEKMKFKLIIVDAFDADYRNTKAKYFYNGNHMDYFRYSPEDSQKIIETFF